MSCNYDCDALIATCTVLDTISCTGDRTFTQELNRYEGSACYIDSREGTRSYVVALLLSLFLGWTGIDRLYTGHVALALLKFMTFAFNWYGWALDFILLLTQRTSPVNGVWVVPDYLPRLWRPTRW
ncbi:TM2 domain [Carpediemonas membranifera]|uniref:TM2 domain n=1 Tax=Carpediemonas membranifera TaxID=201153 RepID=A0A8J6E5H4_9EUKA|nr:TM2 domain [Carpediemonas membranifera]|eukprot:KAG9395767.1 TM2 domain [Carpediemonas membranifera]